jgi:hypothetical protein
VVQRHDLRHGDGKRMTLITFEDGKPLMKDDGKIGTEQECCCGDCECDPFNLLAGCDLQEIIVELVASRVGLCSPDGGTITMTLNADNGYFDSADSGTGFRSESFLTCLNGLYLVQAAIIGSGDCSICDPAAGPNLALLPLFVLRASVDDGGNCCPTGGSYTFRKCPEDIEGIVTGVCEVNFFCDGLDAVVNITCVY